MTGSLPGTATATGLISHGGELFGNHTLLPDGVTKAAHGFAALAAYDETHDGTITNADAVYSDLRVWQDANLNGVSESWKLSTLDDLNITSIATNGTDWQSFAWIDEAGNTHRVTGTFVMDGAVRDASDVRREITWT